MSSETNWSKALKVLSETQPHNNSAFETLKEGMKILYSQGLNVHDEAFRQRFRVFAITTLHFQQARLGIELTKESVLPEAEDFLNFEEIKKKYIQNMAVTTV